jgi:AmiR/NasT family two-component response regulator
VTPTKPYRVLIAEDDVLVGDVIQSELERLGHRVAGRATDGRQAVELTKCLRPDIVLMDIAMPEVDGLEAARQIRDQCPRPIVLLSAHEDTEFVHRAGSLGVGAYLVKPPNGPELARTMAIADARFTDLMELRRLNAELQTALDNVKVLKGLIPICAGCKKVRDDRGFWQQVERYISEHSDAKFSHGLCPECVKEYFPGQTTPSA